LKKITILVSVLLATLIIFTACSAPQSKDTASAGAKPSVSPAPTPGTSGSASPTASSADDSTAIGEIDGQKVILGDLKKWALIAGNFSGTEGAEDSKTLLDDYMSYLAENKELESKGYLKLTADETAAAEKKVSDDFSNIEQSYGITEEDILSQLGVTKDEIISYYKFLAAETKAKPVILGVLTPTEDQIKAKYDSYVADDKESVESAPTAYTDNTNGGITTYYVPEGVRMVRRIFIPVDETMAGAIGTLRGTYDSQADMLRDKGLADIKAVADEALAAIKNGKMKFSDALTKYSKDTKMGKEGYAVIKDSGDMGEEFTKAALALKKVGDISGLISSDEGYQILEYTSDKAPGPVKYDDVKDEIVSDLQEAQMEDAWTKKLNEWKTTAHKVTPDYDAMPSLDTLFQ
jgi:hypothetical protein